MLGQEVLGVFPALAQLGVAVGVERAGLLDDALLHSDLQDVAHLADSQVEHDVELSHSEGGGDLVLDDAGPHPVADDLGALFDGLYAAQVDAYRAIELEGSSTGSDLGAAVGDSDLLPELVDEDHGGPRPVNRAG